MPLLVLVLFLLFACTLPLLMARVLRERSRNASWVALLIALLIGLVVFTLWLVEVAGWQKKGHQDNLVYFLANDQATIEKALQANQGEDALFLFAMTAPCLSKMAIEYPERRRELVALMLQMAEQVTNVDYFPQWKQQRKWDLETYFLSQVGVILGEYQLLTGDERFADQWQASARFLARGIGSSKFKHLASRPNDLALRPADNAAALYALSLHDRYYATDYYSSNFSEWKAYLNRELLYNYTKLPCSGFSGTDRCRLPATGDNMARLTAYIGLVQDEEADDIWRETKHYFKKTSFFLSARLATPPAEGEFPVDCNHITRPIPCGAFPTELAQWAAAIQGDRLTYFQINNRLVWRDFRGKGFKAKQYAMLSTRGKLRALQSLAIRLNAETIR